MNSSFERSVQQRRLVVSIGALLAILLAIAGLEIDAFAIPGWL